MTRSRPHPPADSLDPGKLGLVKAYCADAEKLLLEDRFHEARKVVGEALRLAPNYAAAVHILGVIEMESGSLEEAARLIKRTTELEPTAHDPFYFLGQTLGQLGRHEEAAAAYRAALALRPDLRTVLHELSQTLERLGLMEEAKAAIRRRLALEPGEVGALVQLAKLDPKGLEADERERLIAAAAPDSPRHDRAGACIGLAEVYEAEGNWDQAFAHLKQGNDLLHEILCETDGKLPSQMVLPRGAVPRRMAPQKALDDLARRVSFARLVFDEAFIRKYAGSGHPSQLPIFILGMPRSGSTLIEQILASHPDVHGAGEIVAFENTVVGANWPFEGYMQPSLEGSLRPSGPPKPPNRYFRELGAAYVKALRDHSRRAQRITDKMLTNYLYIGMIHLCLPNAVILNSVRDPVDTCLGCYKQIFATGHETTYDLGVIGRHYALYRRLMEHWHRVLPGRIVDVVYERLVADPEAEIRRLLVACRLPWHAGCLRFYENRRPVNTASLSQVRRPIYKSAVQRWRRYEKHLGPLLEALGPYAPSAEEPQKEERGS